jgi:hypothetical protein
MPFPQRIGPVELPTVNATIYTANRPMRLTFISLTNRTAFDKVVYIYIVPAGGTAADSYLLVGGLTVLAHDTWPKELRIPLIAGDSIQGYSAVAGVNFIGEIVDEKKNL